MFNISFWIDIWSTSENGSQGIQDLCFKTDRRSCCQSFSDRREEIPGNERMYFIPPKT